MTLLPVRIRVSPELQVALPLEPLPHLAVAVHADTVAGGIVCLKGNSLPRRKLFGRTSQVLKGFLRSTGTVVTGKGTVVTGKLSIRSLGQWKRRVIEETQSL